jgi:uncharacterized protein (TIGR00255 family)
LLSAAEALIIKINVLRKSDLSVKSMTGFAKIDGKNAYCSWSWELKSANSKGLDIRCRVPLSFGELEQFLCDRVAKTLKRGSVTVTLTVNWNQFSGAFQVNQNMLDLVISSIPEIETLIPNLGPISATDILALHGVIENFELEITDQQKVDIQKYILDDFDLAIQALQKMRVEEGFRLTNVLTNQLGAISELTNRAKDNASTQQNAIKDRLQNQIQNLLGESITFPMDRMAHEVALLVTKADIREEIDRLVSHEVAAYDYLKSDGAVGRNLDFLCQEFNREANTLCSKSTDIELTKIGLDLKAFIDRFREQIQNIE